jgi:hypothetical protein
MTPVEIMAKAEFLDECDGTLDEAWEKYKKACPVAAQNRIKNMRAALRALAEMEPTEKMMKEATKQTGLLPDRAIKHAVRDFLLAAAAEGAA